MNYLKGLIKCEICQGNYNYKNNNGSEVVLCATKKNYGKSKCDSPTIKQQFILDLIQTHLEHLNKNYSPTTIRLFVSSIKVSNEHIKILYKDGTYSEASFDGNIIF